MKIHIYSQYAADMFMKNNPDESIPIVSILSQNKHKRPAYAGPYFQIYADDIDYGEPAQNRKKPQPENFAGLKTFIDAHTNTNDMIIHCGSGISRSAGCAAAIAEYLHVPTSAWTNPYYHPNLMIYRIVCNELEIPKTIADIQTLWNKRKNTAMWQGQDPDTFPEKAVIKTEQQISQYNQERRR